MGTSPEIIDIYILASYNCFSRQIDIGNIGNSGFGKGVLALSVSQSKGFEFETVLLWKPDLKGDNNNSKLAELLYATECREGKKQLALEQRHGGCMSFISSLYMGGINDQEKT